MNITKTDAETALRDAGRASERSLTLFHYKMASPYLLLWGALWIVAGIIAMISPHNTGMGWFIVDTIGIVATGYLVARTVRHYAEDKGQGEVLRLSSFWLRSLP